jgi:hypothetical protein
LIAHWPVEYYLATKAEPDSSSIGRLSSAAVAIAGIRLAGWGLPAICDAKWMQVSALVDLSTVMMRLRCREKVSMRSKTRQDLIALRLARQMRFLQLDHIHIS